MFDLKPCPFCGHELEQRHRRHNPYARCATDDCMGGKLPLISLDVPDDIERWNRRGREQALEAHVERLNDKLGDIKDSLYERNLRVVGWHLNGEPEPMDNWFENNDWEPEDAPETSLARLKAQWQAEAVQATADAIRYEYEGEVHQDRIADYADDMADELRRQVEGDR